MRCHRVEVDVICLIVGITDVIRSWRNSLDVLIKNICDSSSKSPPEETRQFIDEYIFFYNHEQIQLKTKQTPYETRCLSS